MGLFFGGRRSKSRRAARSIFGALPITRWIGPGITSAGIVAAGYAFLTGKIDLSALDQYRGSSAPAEMQTVSFDAITDKPAGVIRIATFNIRQFSTRKAEKPDVMASLARIVSAFDVVAIQEVRSLSREPVDRLVATINKQFSGDISRPFQSVVSEPIGRSTQKESYAFVWNTSRVAFLPDSAYLIQDGPDYPQNDLLHREPMVASFQAVPTTDAAGRRPFRFTLITAHTDPDLVKGDGPTNEINVLDDVFRSVRDYEWQLTGEDDFILLGDLNVDVPGLAELGQIPGITSVAGHLKTNVIKTKTYDHILVDAGKTTEFLNRAGVVDFQEDLGVTPEQAASISDHLPVFAEFSAYESSPAGENQTQVAVDPASVRGDRK